MITIGQQRKKRMSTPVIIENPVLNSPFDEPSRHFKFTEDGITNEVVEQRRVSAYFIPVPRSRKKSQQGRSLTRNGLKTASRKTIL